MMYATLARYALQLGGVMVVLLILYAYGNHDGRAHVKALWDADKAATAIAANEAVMARLTENRAKESERAAELQKTKESYEKQINDLGKRPAGRLYLPKAAVCHGAALPQGGTNPDGINDPPGSIGLPPGIEENLYALIDKADVIRVRLTALQEACR